MTQTIDPHTAADADPDDLPSNPSSAPAFADVARARVSRRSVLAGGMVAAAGFLTSSLVNPPVAVATPGRGSAGRPLLGFRPIPPSTADEVVVPRGYRARPFIPWGTPLLGRYPEFRPGTPSAGVPGGNTAEDQAQQVGMHHDGMTYFPLHAGRKGSEHGLLVLNHEYTDEFYLQTGAYQSPYAPTYTAEMVRKSQNAHGVSVVEIEKKRSGEWALVRSRRNRRITANTEMELAGPAAGHELVRTAADPQGRRPLGTINNCGNGETPWGTYLTCEENFNGYFRVDPGQNEENSELQGRYGVGGDRNRWATQDPRFVVTPTDANEPNRFGWVVEIDPFSPESVPVKRTALGRLKHEDATVHVTKGGRVVVYMGDDQVFEYVYKFVSSGNWRSMRSRGKSPLDEGTLYVARFDDDGTGTWLPLVHGQGPLTAANGFADQGEVLVKTRMAADLLGATPMDRPEWTAVDPRTGTVYVTLTNNDSRSEANGPNPRTPNLWGHIVRWDEQGGDHAATSFEWDLFLLAGPGDGVDGSTIKAEDSFGSPDGLWLDPDSRAWIQTDGTQPTGNNQMLAADPYRTEGGAPELRRFLTGVVGCEVTGIAMTPDQRTLFVNLQHPGERGGSTWPQNDGLATPRSATVVVTRDDGGVIGT
ncbi:PhoX family phosphatase [Blastococcus jejuensis]|uniref:PhoX family phosphatase n=1 Tax=Blastococcus jejuensis TaxID=351224 RepID=A0ABP6PB53_9ACTN